MKNTVIACVFELIAKQRNFNRIQMRTTIIILLFLLFGSCVPYLNIFIQNKTQGDIEIHEIIIRQWPEEYGDVALQNGVDTFSYKCGQDQQAYLTLKYVARSRSRSRSPLFDSIFAVYETITLTIISNSDTVFFDQRESIRRINEAWAEKNADDPSQKWRKSSSRLIWEIRDSVFTNSRLKSQ